MGFEKLEEYNEKQQEQIRFEQRKCEKYILIPIAEALGVEKKQLERLVYEPSQISGLIIADIKALQRELKRLKKACKELQQQRAKDSQTLFGFLRGYEAREGTK